MNDSHSAFRIVVVGASLGGFRALQTLLAALPRRFPLPVALAQHRSVRPDGGLLVAMMQRCCPLPISEVSDKDEMLPGKIYLAPANYHLLVDGDCFSLSTDERVLSARPSIDVLFESAADAHGAGTVGIVLTGGSADGAQGARRIKAKGGLVAIQDPATAQSPVLPRAAATACREDRVLPLKELVPWLLAALGVEPERMFE